jgi:phytoene dehydrogenase-like protein
VLPPALITLPAPRPLDVIGLRHATGVKNLYLVGRENLPGLGLEGDFISGWGAARLLSGRQPRRLPPARRVLLGS